MKKIFSVILCLLILLADEAKATVVFTDSFTVGADVNLNAYPATPDYAMNLGAAADFKVIAAVDRVESQVNTDAVARITNAAAPTGDQQITATLTSSPGGAAGLAARCNTSGTANCYVVEFVPSLDVVRFYRMDNSTFNTLGSDCSRSFIENFTGRFKVTGSGATISLEAQVDATAVCTYSDTDANRKTSGTPGIHNGGSDQSTFDNISVDNLAAAAVSPLIILSSKRRR